MMQGFEKYFLQMNVTPKRIVYEDFIADIDGTLRSIAETLGIDPARIDSVDLAKTAQRKLAGGDRLSWAHDVLTTGGSYKGYNVEVSITGLLAILADADISGIERPQDFRPLAFSEVSEAGLKFKIDEYIDSVASSHMQS